MTKHGWHWPREEQVANAFEEAFDFSGDPVAAARVVANWAAVIPPYESPIDPERPEFNNVPDFYRGEVIGHGRFPEERNEGC